MKLLDASYEQLLEFADARDRGMLELLIDAIITAEVRRQVAATVDRELCRRAHAPTRPWLPTR